MPVIYQILNLANDVQLLDSIAMVASGCSILADQSLAWCLIIVGYVNYCDVFGTILSVESNSLLL